MLDNRPQLLFVYVMGPTCAGKSVLIEAAKRVWGQSLGLVEVGKAFRAKYPPSYFAGQANPSHTRDEAIKMYFEFIERELSKPDLRLILIDGQPRQSQVAPIVGSYVDHLKLFLHLDASVDTRRARVSARFPLNADGTAQEAATLAMQRIDNDRLTYYEVIMDLMKSRIHIEVFDTDRPASEWTDDVIKHIEYELQRTTLGED